MSGGAGGDAEQWMWSGDDGDMEVVVEPGYTSLDRGAKPGLESHGSETKEPELLRRGT